MATPPDFSAGQVLTAAQMNQVGLWQMVPTAVAGTGVTVSATGVVTLASATTAGIEGCFTSDYSSYKIVVIINSVSADTDLSFRYRTGSTNNSNASYFYANLGLTDGGSAANANGLGATAHLMGGLDAGQTSGSTRTLDMTVFNPQTTNKTTHAHYGWGWSQAGSGTYQTGGGAFDATTSFDGCAFFTANGTSTMSGTIRIYGYN